MGEDCPVFDGLYEFCQLSSGGSAGECITAGGCNSSNADATKAHPGAFFCVAAMKQSSICLHAGQSIEDSLVLSQ